MDELQPRPSTDRHGLFPWNPSVQLGLGIETKQFAKTRSSIASHSSIINDYGDAKHLSENRGPSTARSSNGYPSSTADLVAHLGSGFANPDEAPRFKESDISVLGETLQLREAAGEELQSTKEEENLGESIRAALQCSAIREGKDFLPINDLARIVTRKRVRQELAKLPQPPPPEELEYLTDQIWNVAPSSPSRSSRRKTTRRRIFAILALMEKLGHVADFIKEGLYDSDLPFILSSGTRPGLRQLDRRGDDGELHPIQLFTKWVIHEREYFDNFQWELLAPYFSLSTKEEPKILHYNLENRIILPFIEDEEVKHAGGFGDVWRVKIHPAHHNHCEDSVSLGFT
jgi:hypothetical protein